MRITFVLPKFLNYPIGGYKIVYEYANRLQARGHIVTILIPRTLAPARPPVARLKSRVWAAALRVKHRPLVGWFPLDPRVRLRLVRDLRPAFVPDGDAVVATGWETAAPVAALPLGKGRPFYLIQHYEEWGGAQSEVDATWTLPLHKIVIARWLAAKAQVFGDQERTTHIPNGMDFGAFSQQTPPALRSARVGLLAHHMPWKGTQDGLDALALVRARRPGLAAVLFGTAPRPAALPDWAEYVENPTPEALRALYNSCAVFVQASWSEGWGLTATEAMACGCALVTTDNGGSQDYALDGETALVVPPKRPDLLAEATERLLADDALRLRLAAQGHAHVQQYTWDRAVAALEAALQGRPAPAR